MARFKCIAAGCSVVSDRRRAPATCLDRNRCQFEECEATKAEAVVTASPPALTLVIATREFPVHSSTVLGRNGDLALEIFRADLSASRRHCELTLRDGAWTLNALSETSPTLLDGARLPVNAPVPLRKPRHELVLGSLRMELQLGLPDAIHEPQPFAGELDDFFKNQ